MTPDLQALLDRLTAALAPSTPDRMNYGFPIQLTQAEVKVLVDAYAKLAEASRVKSERDAALSELAKLRERTTKLSIDYTVALDEKGKALAELAKLRDEAERWKFPTIMAVDLARGLNRPWWACTCGRKADSEYGLYHDCPDAHCPSRSSPPKDPAK